MSEFWVERRGDENWQRGKKNGMIYGRVAAPWHRTVRPKGRGKEVVLNDRDFARLSDRAQSVPGSTTGEGALATELVGPIP